MDKKSIIESITAGSPNRLREKYFAKYHQDVFQSILFFTKDIDDLPFKWRVWHWMNELSELPTCQCGNLVSRHISISDGYRKWCSAKCAANDPGLRQKAQSTILEKYGVTHYSKTDEFVEKVKATSIDKWGVDNFAKTEEYKSKSKQTYHKKWGVSNFTKTEEYVKKAKEAYLRKWGVDSYLKTDEGKKNIRAAISKRFNHDHIFKSEIFRKANFDMCKDINYQNYIGGGISQFKCDLGLTHSFQIDTDNYWGRRSNGVNLCTICSPISDSSSLKESMLFDFISSNYDGQIIRSYRESLEIDIFLPDLKIGFEFNGLYWHSELIKDKNYHLNKTLYFRDRGIRIIHIWEDDFTRRRSIIESQILNLIGKTSNKIYARQCEVRLVKTREAKQFLNSNHIQGWVRSNLKLGLYHNGLLVSLMTFDHCEGRKKMPPDEWNLNRFCSLLNSNVIGGASKLFNFFLKNYEPERVVSYADRDWSDGNLYHQLGFKLISESNPDYKYLLRNKRVHKSRFRKSRLGYEITESKFVNKMGIIKVWDCGKLKFEICLV